MMFAHVAFAVAFAAFAALVFLPSGTRTHRLSRNWFLTVDFPTINVHSENTAFLDKIRISRIWFQIGAWVTLLLILPSVFLLISNLWTLVSSQFKDSNAENGSAGAQPTLQVIVPGYNLPFSDLGYYALTLLVITVLHEFGHATAARSEAVDTLDYGIMFFGLCVPMAYVSLPTKDLDLASFVAKVRILAAGVWHNVVLAIAAFAILTSMPWLMAPAFKHGGGLLVTSVAPDSILLGPSGLTIGDVITDINGCAVNRSADLRGCVSKAIQQPQVGWCIEAAAAAANRGQTKQDCVQSTNGGQDLCFEYFLLNDKTAYASLNVRQELLSPTANVCRANSSDECLSGRVCMWPAVESLARVRREAGKDFLFVGDPSPIYADLGVTDYRLRIEAFFALNYFPAMAEKLCYYIVILSGALAALNVVPCWRLDGHLILETVIESKTKKFWGPKTRRKLTNITTHFGTALLFLNVGIGLLITVL